MTVLNKKEIISYMKKRNIENRLIVTPLFKIEDKTDEIDSAIDQVSVDVRLGNEFIVMRKQMLSCLNISQKKINKKNFYRYPEKIRINFFEEFVLHPNQLIIGSTLEYIKLPNNLMAYVSGKSSWGRMGLIIATAIKIDPGFKGCITLEMINLGEIPIEINPGIPIAQLIFHKTRALKKDDKYSGIFKCPTGPQFPNFIDIMSRYKFWSSDNSDIDCHGDGSFDNKM